MRKASPTRAAAPTSARSMSLCVCVCVLCVHARQLPNSQPPASYSQAPQSNHTRTQTSRCHLSRARPSLQAPLQEHGRPNALNRQGPSGRHTTEVFTDGMPILAAQAYTPTCHCNDQRVTQNGLCMYTWPLCDKSYDPDEPEFHRIRGTTPGEPTSS
jgi:hypothetical protein